MFICMYMFRMNVFSLCVSLRVVQFLVVWMASTFRVSCSICDVRFMWYLRIFAIRCVGCIYLNVDVSSRHVELDPWRVMMC